MEAKDDHSYGRISILGERLNRLGLFSLQKRHLRGNMISVYKILNGTQKVNGDSLFTLCL